MRFSTINNIAHKEILSTMRDRRAIISTLLIPLLLLPVMMIGLPLLIGGLIDREISATSTELGVVNETTLPPSLRTMLQDGGFAFVPVTDGAEAVESGIVTAALELSGGSDEALASGGQLEFSVYAKASSMQSELHASRVVGTLNQYSDFIVAERLHAIGVDLGVLAPLRITSVDTSTEAERSSGQLGWIIPFFIALWILMGGQMTAIDSTAGEKERGTIEALLVAPITRTEIVVGKFLATMTFGLAAAVMAIVGYLAGGTIMRGLIVPRLGSEGSEIIAVMGGSISTNAVDLGLLLITAILLAAVMSAALLAIAMFARSFKEAQSYIGPLSFVVVLPAVALQFKDMFGFSDQLYYIPLVNALVAMDDILRGAYDFSAVLTAWVILAATALLLLRLAHRNFSREEVLFRN